MVRRVIPGLMLVSVLAVSANAGAPLMPKADRLRMPVAATAEADRVVIGRMGRPEPDPVKVKITPHAAHPSAYRVYRLAVTETLAGEKAVTEVRVWGEVLGNPPPPPMIEPSQLPNPIAPDADGLYFLARHHSGEFYSVLHFVPRYWKDGYKHDLEQARRHLALLADPIASLGGKVPEDRLATAVLLLTRHQAYRGAKWKAIPDRENKLILAALAEVGWGDDADSPLNPVRVVRAAWRQSQVRAVEAGGTFTEPVIPATTHAEVSAFLRDWVRRDRDIIRIEQTTPE